MRKSTQKAYRAQIIYVLVLGVACGVAVGLVANWSVLHHSGVGGWFMLCAVPACIAIGFVGGKA